MNPIVFILFCISMVLVLGILFFGIFTMARKNETQSGKFQNKIMQWRVAIQFIALLLFALAYFLFKKSS